MQKKGIKYCILCLLLVFSQLARAQADRITASGVITDEQGESIIGATVKTAGSQQGTISDANGKFSIQVAPNSVLQINYMGYKPQNILIKDATQLKIVLQEDVIVLTGTVVTALGITRDEKSLPYARQTVNTESMTENRSPNIVNMLSGQAAGLRITPAGGPLSSTRVVIRGENYLSGNNNALFVIDGVPVHSMTMGTTGGESGDLDFGNILNSMNPDDIENVEVLRGANAAALYGSEGARGVILITTKKPTKKKGLGVSYGFNAMFSYLYNFPTYQNIYGPGQSVAFERQQGFNWYGNPGEGSPFDPNLPYGIWNPNMTGQDQRSFGQPMLGFDIVGRNGKVKKYVPHEETIRNMYQISNMLTHSVSIDKVVDGAAVRITYTNMSGNDILEKFNELNRHNLSLVAQAKITDFLDVDFNVRYAYEEVLNRGFRNESSRNPLYQIANLPRDASLEELIPWKQPDGTPFNFKGFTNPYWLLNETGNTDTKHWLNGTLQFNVKFNKYLSLRLKGTADIQPSNGYSYSNKFSPFDQEGQYKEFQKLWKYYNYEGVLQYNKRFGDIINLNTYGGATVQTTSNSGLNSEIDQLIFQDKYTLGNAASDIRSWPDIDYKQKQALFAVASVGFKDRVYLDLTVRNEWSSALPLFDNDYFYWSAGTSIMMSDIIKFNKKVLSYWKLRASYATVGNDMGPYNLRSGYDRNSGEVQFKGMPYFRASDILRNPYIRPEMTHSYELGTDIRFWDSRINLDFTYYHKSTIDQILQADTPLGSGWAREFINAGEIMNRGFEVSLQLTPVRTKLFTWNSTINWSKNYSEVVSLQGSVDRLELAYGEHNLRVYAAVGKPFGAFYGHEYKYDDQGRICVAIDGKAQYVTDQYLGHAQPDWFGGWINNFRIARVHFGALLDVQMGGRVWSHTAYRGGVDGNTVQSLEGRWDRFFSKTILGESNEEIRGFYKPEHTVTPGADYGSNAVWYVDGTRPKGVYFGNTVYDESVAGLAGQDATRVWVNPMDHWTHNNTSSASRYMYDATYVKLREVSVGYELPAEWLKKTFITGAKLSLVGRNVAILYQGTPKGLDPQATTTSGNGQGLEKGFNLPMATWGFDLKISF